MKKKIIYFVIMLFTCNLLFTACEKDREILIPYPHDITFEDQTLGLFSYSIPNTPFKSGDAESGIVTMNVINNGNGNYSGFALSNKNSRHYPWPLSPTFAPATPLTPAKIQAYVDTLRFSVNTSLPNRTSNYLVACVKNDDAFITLDKPSIVEHILVANTSYNFLLATYGSIYSGTLNAATQEYSTTGTIVRNPFIANTSSAMYGRFFLPGPNNVNLIRLAGFQILEARKAGKVAADAARALGKSKTDVAADSTKVAVVTYKGYIKLTAKGFLGTAQKGNVDFWLAVQPNIDTKIPTLNYIAGNWFKVDLTSLGTVDKLVFNLTSDYVDGTGKMLTPPYFCLDGIRIKK